MADTVAVVATSPTVSNGRSLKAQHHLSSGALSGFCSAVALQPLDLLKTRLQQGANGLKRPSVIATARGVVRDDGFFGLWRGTVPTVVRNVPGVAVYFYALSAIRTELASVPYFRSTSVSQDSRTSSSSALVKLSSTGNLLAGAIGRTSVGFLLNPITVLKARYESNRFSEYRSMIGAFQSLLRDGGVRGLFTGFTATALRDAPYAGLSLVFYEKSKDVMGRLLKPEWSVPNAVLHSSSAAVAAMLATFVTSPADCVKTRMQVNPADHPTLRKAIIRTYTERGLNGFFYGSTLRIFRKAASGAIGWTVYEGLLLFLRDR